MHMYKMGTFFQDCNKNKATRKKSCSLENSRNFVLREIKLKSEHIRGILKSRNLKK